MKYNLSLSITIFMLLYLYNQSFGWVSEIICQSGSKSYNSITFTLSVIARRLSHVIDKKINYFNGSGQLLLG